jgi:hypothetical protein
MGNLVSLLLEQQQVVDVHTIVPLAFSQIQIQEGVLQVVLMVYFLILQTILVNLLVLTIFLWIA